MAANLDAGICPKCKEYLMLKRNVPFVVCPRCGQSISNHEAVTLLESRCKDAEQVNDLIADCVALEIQFGPELPYLILAQICENFPQLESPAYLLVKMLGFEYGMVRQYLKNFAAIKSQPSNVPWAEEFLDLCLDYRNMEMADLFYSYINNKVRPERQAHYREKVTELYKEYTYKSDNPNSTKLLLAFYGGASAVNVLLFPCFMLLSGLLGGGWGAFALNAGIAMLVLCLEMLVLYFHHRTFGNRLNMGSRERLLMTIFLSSMVFAIGSAVMGTIWAIKL